MTADHRFSVILEPQKEGGYTVLVPALPEVISEGDTEGAAIASVEEAIRLALAYRNENGISIPDDSSAQLRQVTVTA